jgi:hypothetical protein
LKLEDLGYLWNSTEYNTISGGIKIFGYKLGEEIRAVGRYFGRFDDGTTTGTYSTIERLERQYQRVIPWASRELI